MKSATVRPTRRSGERSYLRSSFIRHSTVTPNNSLLLTPLCLLGALLRHRVVHCTRAVPGHKATFADLRDRILFALRYLSA